MNSTAITVDRKPRRTIWRRLPRILAALFVVYFCAAGFIWWAMCQPPETFGRVMMHMPGPIAFLLFPFVPMWTHARAGNLHIGDAAPDFSLVKYDHSGQIQLSALNKTQPVVLVFGSYT
jgi:hypothetical protein